ncbi:MAG TPA: arsenate reductase (azurin) small subunit [Burkholderiaceae bacterium]|nr:arsenate reductase (azurin) small subunit [Burkholderiaceae bacterium]HQR72145.1 arsenate reductase (azurin) small subunit [Burkholderiaceae bacterium]
MDSNDRGVSRRVFLKVGGASAVGGALGAGLAGDASAATGLDTSRTVLPYPRQAVGMATKMTKGAPVNFSYPDASSPCVAVKLGTAVPGGVGPDRDIVAYSTLCTHMGCPVAYDAGTNTFKCGCHFSLFDAEKAGQMICGQATENLPRIRLDYNAQTGAITATGIDGLIYGRQANVL